MNSTTRVMFRRTPVHLRKSVHGSAAGEYFHSIREQIVKDLKENKNDHSLAGKVDAGILEVVEYINGQLPSYVTSSSCSGRVSLFHRAKPIEATSKEKASRKRGAVGRGTLFQSHDPLPEVRDTIQHSLIPALSQFRDWRATLTEPLHPQSELLQLKFEPMILHVLCADFDAAAALLQCASEAAQTNSGIISCSRGTSEHRKITCCITSPVIMDVPLFSSGGWILSEGGLSDPAWESLLTYCVTQANELFTENEKTNEAVSFDASKSTDGCCPSHLTTVNRSVYSLDCWVLFG